MELTKKNLEKISGAIITSFVNQHFLEEAMRTGLFRHRVKNNVNRTIKELMHIESEYYNKIEDVDDKGLGDKLIANKLEFVKWVLNEFDFNDFCKIQEICKAYTLDKETLTKTSDKILTFNGVAEDEI
jgi:hypothetical protein